MDDALFGWWQTFERNELSVAQCFHDQSFAFSYVFQNIVNQDGFLVVFASLVVES